MSKRQPTIFGKGIAFLILLFLFFNPSDSFAQSEANESTENIDSTERRAEVVIGYSIKMIADALIREGYYSGTHSNVMNAEIKKALNEFQEDNNLTVGTIDVATLKALKIVSTKED